MNKEKLKVIKKGLDKRGHLIYPKHAPQPIPEEALLTGSLERLAQAMRAACEQAVAGAWSALWEIGAKDVDGNVTIGDVLLHDVQGSYLHATDRLVAAMGVRDVVLVETKDAVLLAHRGRAQEVRHIVQRLQAQNRPEHRQHREVYRPWGSFDAIHADARYQVKRITVNPGAQLSLQLHHHRAEHWIVVKGTARVTRGEEAFLLTENQSTYIPVGQPHRLENPGVIPLVMIEVQTDSYPGEDDIVRLSDVYGRS
ncbi:MAG: cupin domain-containing protein [Candidatus Methanomethylicaceae archaeon]